MLSLKNALGLLIALILSLQLLCQWDIFSNFGQGFFG
jgi:hypothetical protein